MCQRYDMIAIGAGPGGYEAAIRAAQLGKRAAVIEKRDVGGTCLNRGCIPTKTLMYSAHLLEEWKNCGELGIQAGQAACDFGKLQERKREVVQKLRGGIRQLFKANQIDFVEGEALILEPGRVKVRRPESESELFSDRILIATGSVPSIPPIPGLALPGVVASDEILDGEGREFQNLIIIGGGVVGVELAAVYQALGAQVSIIEATKQLLPSLDKEVARNMAMILKKKGVDIHTQATVRQVRQTEGGLLVSYEEKGKAAAAQGDGVLVAVGRKANIEGLFQGKPIVETQRGAIVVDEDFKTSVEGIYAVGDVVYGNIQLAHMASAQGIAAVEKMFGVPSKVNLNLVPSCIYTSPEIAAVGMSADEARQKGIRAREGKFLMAANGKSLISREERSFIKVLYEEKSNKILGAAMMCARATDMISEFTLAMAKSMTLEDMSSIIRPHPTYAEGITEAVNVGLGCSIHSAPLKKGFR